MNLAKNLSALTLLSIAVAAGLGCKKGGSTDPTASTATAAPKGPETATPAPAATNANEPFAGTYQRTHELTMKNGRRVSLDNSKGTSSITVGGGKIVYVQTYPSNGSTSHVTQNYSYAPGDVHTVPGGFDVNLKFDSMQADTKSYNPDKNNPKLEARRTGTSWQIGFTSVDDKGVWGGVEFQ